MSQKKLAPSEFDLLASAWESVKDEIIYSSEATYREQGWKTIYDLCSDSGVPIKTMTDRINKQIAKGQVEKKQILARLNGNPKRLVNFYRPTLTSRLTKK